MPSKWDEEDRYRLIRALEIWTLSGKRPSDLEAQMPLEPKPEYQLWVVDRQKEEMTLRMRSRILAMIEDGLIEEN